MAGDKSSEDEALIAAALAAASHTRMLVVEEGARHKAANAFAQQFGSARAIVVADGNTLRAAGRDVVESFRRADRPADEPFVFGPDIYAEQRCVDKLQAALGATDAIPVAVGSGTINDLTKLAAHRVGRPYMAVATAASMDGYTAYGASITAKGSKQTFDCPAPQAVVADLEVIAAAPAGLNAAGYADLVAKIPAGADWIVADSLGVEAIEPAVWDTVQKRLHDWVDSPEKIASNEPAALRRLVNGLMMTGFAMQVAKSSRPASGAEHQFSHLWDMQHHRHNGVAPSHGFKVGIGTLASIALYEELLSRDLATLDVERTASKWPTLTSLERRVTTLLGSGELTDTAIEEMRAKHVPAEALREQLSALRGRWPDLRDKLARQLLPLAEVESMLHSAGCAFEPEQIGISRERLRESYEQALFIRRRFTVLDLAQRAGLLEKSLDKIFGRGGAFGQ
jgi:glycerol-1-phosphate dehydrogenase [NAD(P)+]